MSEKKWVGYLYAVGGFLSMMSGIVVSASYLFNKSLRRNPGMLIFWQILSQSFIDMLTSALGVMIIRDHDISGQSCEVFGSLGIYFYFLGFNYAICLCVEVLKKIKTPMDMKYRKRSKIYHYLSHSFAFCLSVIFTVFKKTGRSLKYFCLIKVTEPIKYALILPLLLFIPTLITTIMITIRLSQGLSLINYFLIKHTLYLTAYFLIWSFIIVNILVNRSEEASYAMLDYFSAVLLSSAGLILSLIRLSGHYIIRSIRKRNKVEARLKQSVQTCIKETLRTKLNAPISPDISSEYQSDYVNLFSSMSTESAFSAILVINSSLARQINVLPFATPWPEHYYSNCHTSKIDEEALNQLYLGSSLKEYCKLYLDKENIITYTEYAAEVFRSIRQIENIENSQIALSFNVNQMIPEFKRSYSNKGGRSGSFFLYSADRKYILKSITKKELKVLLGNFLLQYHIHIQKYENSLLSRILGVYLFELNARYRVKLILMQSIYLPENVKSIYDIKGSKIDRQTDEYIAGQTTAVLNPNKVYKDIDFLNLQKNLYLGALSADFLMTAIEADSVFLHSFRIMDYSLLVIVKTKYEFSKFYYRSTSDAEVGYCFGIIDFLQEYDRSKKIETFTKRFFKFKPRIQLSSINPNDYMQRFLRFVKSILMVELEWSSSEYSGNIAHKQI